MITGSHFLVYSKSPDADRAFLRDVLGFKSVDAQLSRLETTASDFASRIAA